METPIYKWMIWVPPWLRNPPNWSNWFSLNCLEIHNFTGSMSMVEVRTPQAAQGPLGDAVQWVLGFIPVDCPETSRMRNKIEYPKFSDNDLMVWHWNRVETQKKRNETFRDNQGCNRLPGASRCNVQVQKSFGDGFWPTNQQSIVSDLRWFKWEACCFWSLISWSFRLLSSETFQLDAHIKWCVPQTFRSKTSFSLFKLR